MLTGNAVNTLGTGFPGQLVAGGAYDATNCFEPTSMCGNAQTAARDGLE